MSASALVSFAISGIGEVDRDELIEPAGIAAALYAPQQGLARRRHGLFHLFDRIRHGRNTFEIDFDQDITSVQLAKGTSPSRPWPRAMEHAERFS